MKNFAKLLLLSFVLASCSVLGSENVAPGTASLAAPLVEKGVSGYTTETHFNSDFTTVRLAYAQPFNYAVSGMTYNSTYFHVHTKNLGSPLSRHVYIHYTTGGAWMDYEVPYVGDYGTHSRWSGSIPPNTCRFVVKYVSDAGTYWDNNRGADYFVTPWANSGSYKAGVVGGGITLLSAKAVKVNFGGGSYGWKVTGTMAVDTNTFPNGPQGGGIYIKNQYYGANYWQTYYHFSYNYSPTASPNVRIYNFESDPVGNQTSANPMDSWLEFVLFAYKSTGATSANVYWDNNFGQNYKINKVDGTSIQ